MTSGLDTQASDVQWNEDTAYVGKIKRYEGYHKTEAGSRSIHLSNYLYGS